MTTRLPDIVLFIIALFGGFLAMKFVGQHRWDLLAFLVVWICVVTIDRVTALIQRTISERKQAASPERPE